MDTKIQDDLRFFEKYFGGEIEGTKSCWTSLKILCTNSDAMSDNGILAIINLINKETPWSECEPTWWVEMMEFDRSIKARC